MLRCWEQVLWQTYDMMRVHEHDLPRMQEACVLGMDALRNVEPEDRPTSDYFLLYFHMLQAAQGQNFDYRESVEDHLRCWYCETTSFNPVTIKDLSDGRMIDSLCSDGSTICSSIRGTPDFIPRLNSLISADAASLSGWRSSPWVFDGRLILGAEELALEVQIRLHNLKATHQDMAKARARLAHMYRAEEAEHAATHLVRGHPCLSGQERCLTCKATDGRRALPSHGLACHFFRQLRLYQRALSWPVAFEEYNAITHRQALFAVMSALGSAPAAPGSALWIVFRRATTANILQLQAPFTTILGSEWNGVSSSMTVRSSLG